MIDRPTLDDRPTKDNPSSMLATLLVDAETVPGASFQYETRDGYSMFGLNHISVTLRWDDDRSPGHKNVCR